jgi:hypothetical protein
VLKNRTLSTSKPFLLLATMSHMYSCRPCTRILHCKPGLACRGAGSGQDAGRPISLDTPDEHFPANRTKTSVCSTLHGTTSFVLFPQGTNWLQVLLTSCNCHG